MEDEFAVPFPFEPWLWPVPFRTGDDPPLELDPTPVTSADAPPEPPFLEGGFGCLGPPFPDGPEDGDDGGGTTPPPAAPPPRPAAPTPAALDPAPLPPAPAAAPTPLIAVAPRAARATPPAASDPTAAAPAAAVVPVPRRSPPVNAGAPPRTAENSFGICQQSIKKISAAPITSNAFIAGVVDVLTAWASGIHPSDMSIPTPISRYSSMILTPFATPNPMYRST